MKEKICRLCLRTITENYQEIEETVKNVLSLNLGISKDSVMCIECSNNIQAFFNLKSACVDIRKRETSLTNLKNVVNLDPVNIENANNPDSFTELKDEMRCSFCTNLTGADGLISLHESKETIFLVDVLEKYIPEMDFSNVEELLTCKSCLDGIQSVSSFLMKCLDVEEKISKYTEIEGTDDKGQIELQNVQQFIFKPMLKFEGESCINELEQIYDGIPEKFDMKTEAEVKYEIEVDNPEPFIKTEVVDVKSEQVDYDSFNEPVGNHKNSLDVTVYKCEVCPYETIDKDHLNDHMLIHKNHPGKKMFKCEICGYETKSKRYLNDHELVHKDPSEIIMFKCELCAFKTKRQRDLNRHILLIHENPSEKTLYKCEECTYETRHKQYFKRHKLIHKSSSEVKMFKCEICEYETKHKPHLNDHRLVHKARSELVMFKCGLCRFETKSKRGLSSHLLYIHDTASKKMPFKCAACSYETRNKQNLKRHILTHKSHPRTKKYKCGLCTFEGKRIYDLKRHIFSIHDNPSEKIPLKCESCSYETRYKQNLKRHKLTHKSLSEVTMFKSETSEYETNTFGAELDKPLLKCDACTYETRNKQYLRRHTLTHKTASEVIMFKCELCTFETKRKGTLKNHMLTHTDPSEMTVVKCEICEFETLLPHNLRRHMSRRHSEISPYKCDACPYTTKLKSRFNEHKLIHQT